MSTFVVLGLGSNLGDRSKTLAQAVSILCHGPQAPLKQARCSELFESDALLLPGSPTDWNIPFLNLAVAGYCENCSPLELLKFIKSTELKLGRQERTRWAPREIDIDILTFGNERLSTPTLSIPHPAIPERPFALWPLAALHPKFRLLIDGRPQEAITTVFKWGYARGEIPCKTWKATRLQQDSFRKKLTDDIQWVEGPLPRADLVGIINVTPDSFSDAGHCIDPLACRAHAQELFAAGASILDIGAESTRPDASSIEVAEEQARLIPALEAIHEAFSGCALKPILSVDTRRPAVAEAALRVGIDWLNDVQGFGNPSMLSVARKSNVRLVAMHSLGIPPSKTQVLDKSRSASAQLQDWLNERFSTFTQNGIETARLIFDVGIGFGKTAEQSWDLVANAGQLTAHGAHLLFGHSRKSFLSLISPKAASERDPETALLSVALNSKGIDYLRIHNVAASMKALCLHSTHNFLPLP